MLGGEMPIFAGGIITGVVLMGFMCLSFWAPSWTALVQEWGAPFGGYATGAGVLVAIFTYFATTTSRKNAALAALGIDLSDICAYAKKCMELGELIFNAQQAAEKLEDYRNPRKIEWYVHDEAKRLEDQLSEAKQAILDYIDPDAPKLDDNTIEHIAKAAGATGEMRLSDILNTYQIQRSRLSGELERFMQEGGRFPSRASSREVYGRIDDAALLYVRASNLFDFVRRDFSFNPDEATGAKFDTIKMLTGIKAGKPPWN